MYAFFFLAILPMSLAEKNKIVVNNSPMKHFQHIEQIFGIIGQSLLWSQVGQTCEQYCNIESDKKEFL